MTAPMLLRRTFPGVLTLALAGCASLFVNPPPKYIFRLTPAATFPPDLPRLRTQLLVDLPSVPAALDRRRIALSRQALLLDYFADAEWADTLSALVQRVLANSFENSRAITAIDGSMGLRADFILGTEIRHFEAQYDARGGPPDVQVSIVAKLAKTTEREVVAQSFFERRLRAGANDLPSIIAAFDAAQQAVAAQIVVWTVTNAAVSARRHRL